MKLIKHFSLLAAFCLSAPVLAQSNATENDFATALIGASGARASYSEFFASLGRLPDSLQELGLSENDFENEFVENFAVDSGSNSILVGLSNHFGSRQWVSFVPVVDQNNFTVNFECRTTVSADWVENTGCVGGLSYEGIDITVDRDFFIQTIIATAPIRLNFQESVQATGSIPTSLLELGASDQVLDQAYINNFIIQPDSGQLLFGLSPVYGTNQWLVFEPIVRRFNVRAWRCRTTLPSSIAANIGCTIEVNVEDIIR